MRHVEIEARNASFHVVLAGHGPPLVLLHGWPEFWLTTPDGDGDAPAMVEGVGHFPHREDPDRTIAEMAAVFECVRQRRTHAKAPKRGHSMSDMARMPRCRVALEGEPP